MIPTGSYLASMLFLVSNVKVVLDCMNFCLCEDAENQEGAVHLEGLTGTVDSELQSLSSSVINLQAHT